MNAPDRPQSAATAGLKAGLPIFLGYVPVAISFGLLARNTGLTFVETAAFSALVFAGASQFLGLALLASGAGLVSIVGATLLVNLRHLLMSASVAARLSQRRLLPMIAFGVTDETFAVASTHARSHDPRFLVALEATAYSGWLLGTLIGHLFGGVLPPVLQVSFGFGLYALFVILLVGPVKASRLNLLVAAAAAGTHLTLTAADWPAAGIRIVLAILVGAAVGALLPAPSSRPEAESHDAGGTR
ncbi:MAG: AzlC family ABC transporter permease [Spirochaetales bacterium]